VQHTTQGTTTGKAVIGGAAVVCTVLLTGGLLRAPRLTVAAVALLGVALLAAAAVRDRRRLSRLELSQLLAWLALVLPVAALVGPVAALPALPRVFAFRIILALIAVLGLLVLALGRPRAEWVPGRPLTLLFCWAGWLTLSLAWAPMRGAGVRYLLVAASMLALMVATAWAGSSPRRLRALCILLAIGYGLIVTVPVLELFAGVRLPTSVLFGSSRDQVTSFFRNQNHLGTFVGMAWPFLLATFAFTRRTLPVVGALAGMALGLFALLHTGSRSGLIVYGVETLAIAPFLWSASSRAARRLLASLDVVLVAAFAAIAFNTSQNTLLRSLNVSGLYSEAAQGVGSGGVRLSITGQALALLPRFAFVGAGPGNADYFVTAEGEHPHGVNLHDWWLELLADGGLPGFALFVTAYVMLAARMARVRQRTRDPFLRYLSLCIFVALIGYVVGAFGPGSVLSFGPMWILLGMAAAVDRCWRDEMPLREAA
jgi:teichuronic acid biosynthesis protein TuaE